MAGRKENLKSLFTNTRTRIIIIFTAILLIVAVVFGIMRFRASISPVSSPTGARVATTPGSIRSVPGSRDPSAQYAGLVYEANIQQAEQAKQTGGSSIPTIIRIQEFGEGVEGIGPDAGEGGLGFTGLALEESTGGPAREFKEQLEAANCSKEAVQKAVSQGATLSELRSGCSCLQLKETGYNLQELDGVCNCEELKQSGFNALQMKEAGFSAGRLYECGFDACEVRDAGFSALEMKAGGFSDGELKGAGFSREEIDAASGLPTGIREQNVRDAGCDLDALKNLREAGTSAAAIKRITGCSAEQLKAAGFDARELKEAGFSAAELSKAGYTPQQLHSAGYAARDLLNAGLEPDALAAAGYTPAEIKEAERMLPPQMTIADIKEAGCDAEALKRLRQAGVSAQLIRKHNGCDLDVLNASGFSDQSLANAGFTPQEIGRATAQAEQAEPVSDAVIEAAGCDPEALRSLVQKGVSAKAIKNRNGCTLADLKAAGYDAKDLANAGFTPTELLRGGFNPQDLTNAGLNPAGVIAEGRIQDCSQESLSTAVKLGVDAATIRDTLGCDVEQLQKAGYSAEDLRKARFTAGQLKNLGMSPVDLKNAGFTAKELVDAGIDPVALKNAGYTAQELKNAGVRPEDLIKAGVSPASLKQAGFSAESLRRAGVTAAELKAVGYDPQQLKEADFSASQLLEAGLTPEQLKKAGYSATDLKKAGLSPEALREAGFSDKDIQEAGFAVAGAGISEIPEQPGITPERSEIPRIGRPGTAPAQAADTTEQLQQILKQQQAQVADQRYQQKLDQRRSLMMSAATEALQEWQEVAAQVNIEGNPPEENQLATGQTAVPGMQATPQDLSAQGGPRRKAIIKTGDVMFAVIDTAVDSDEPSPILATIVSGKLKGAKLIGSFNLPPNADKMVISFNTMSVPGADGTTSISAYAIDPNTARTALASYTNNHYLYRYGSLFASTFLEGFGNAFQSANTTITIGGTGGVQSTTVHSGIGRTILENAVIGLAELGKTWGQFAQQEFNRPITVQVCAGTGIGVLFTQDVASL